MSTAGGPKLKGIGRSGDSDIVLCLDAHDAGSYPGEPTTNYIKHVAAGFPNGWNGDGSSQSGLSKGPSSEYDSSLWYNNYPTVLWTPGTSLNCYLNGSGDIPTDVLSTEWTFSCYIKAQDAGTLRTSDNDLSVYLYYPSSDGSSAGTVVDVGDGWYRVSRSRTGSSNYISLAGFSGFRAGVKFYLSGAQLEKKSYPTPYVSGFTNSGYPDTEVYDGRPASVNLMIHGNVGTGQTFSDSSPSIHTITTVGNTTHSSAQSKFSGGSVYFDGTGDKLTLASSTDWAVGATATIDCWVYPTDAYTTNHRLWCVNNNSTHLDGYIASNGYFYMHGGIIQANTQTFPRNVWTHIAVTYNSGAVKIYFNGVSQSLAGTTTGYNISGTGQLHIGNFFSGSYEYAGYMDEFRITKGTALWTSAFNPPTRRNRNAPVVDLSGSDNGGNFNTNDMTDVATYRDGQVIEPVASAVWDFDGTDDWVSLPNDIGYTDAVSVFAWVKRDTNTGILGGYHVICGTVGLELSFEAVSNYLRNGIEVNGTRYVSNDGSTIGTGTWHYVGFTWSTSDYSKKSYIDGVNVGTQSTGSTGTSSYSFSGRSLGMWGGVSYALNGKIAAYQVYDTALTAQQVKQNFNSQRSRFKV